MTDSIQTLSFNVNVNILAVVVFLIVLGVVYVVKALVSKRGDEEKTGQIVETFRKVISTVDKLYERVYGGPEIIIPSPGGDWSEKSSDTTKEPSVTPDVTRKKNEGQRDSEVPE